MATPRVRAGSQHRLRHVYERALRARASVEAGAEGKLEPVAGMEPPGTDPSHDTHMEALARQLDLTSQQRDLVWSIVACSFDPRIVPHLEALGGAHARRGLSLAAYAVISELDDESLLDLAHWLAAPNPLVSTGLVTATEAASPAARAYVASPRLVSFLHNRDVSIEPLRILRADRPLVHDPQQAAALDAIAVAIERGADAVLVIEGPAGSGRATACACATGASMLVLDCARIRADLLGEALLGLRRELLLRPSAVPVLANAEQVVGEGQHEQRALVRELVEQTTGPLVITTTTPGLDLGSERPVVRVRWGVPNSEVRAQLWQAAVCSAGASVRGDLTHLAFRYRVGPAAIERAVASARSAHPAEAPLDEAALAAGLRHNIAERMGGLARRVEVTQSWEDLVIADDTGDLIAALVGRIRNAHQVLDVWGYRNKIARGAGVAALFSGPPGTGKTMVAGLIARELDLELYQVDLSKIVSKWVGETEKNLARVFDAAEEGHALLLFDEADALFGQRSSEMKSATDRYANLEVNYLLQRVEAFGGITILTTNLESAIDDALKRRLAAHVVFAKPDEDERAALWERQCTTGRAPLSSDVDYADLAVTFPHMSGANIRNAAISAAFLAARDRSPRITQDHLIRAARAEYRSMGHVLAESISSRTTSRRSL